MSPRVRFALRLGGATLAAGGCLWLGRHVAFGQVARALATASAGPIVLAIVINLGPRTAVRAGRTLTLLRTLPEGRIRVRELMPVLLGSYAAGYLVPGPTEELFHAASLTRFGFRPRDLVPMHLVDKALGVMSVALVALPVVRGVSRVPLLLGIAVALALGGAGVLLSRTRGSISVAALARALACLVVSNLASVAIVHLSLAAVGAPSSLGPDLEIFAATACACILPLTPGQVGVVEAAFAATAAHRGVPPSAALTAAILYHGAHVVPLIVAGLPSMIRVLVANRDAGKPQAARGPETCALAS